MAKQKQKIHTKSKYDVVSSTDRWVVKKLSIQWTDFVVYLSFPANTTPHVLIYVVVIFLCVVDNERVICSIVIYFLVRFMIYNQLKKLDSQNIYYNFFL